MNKIALLAPLGIAIALAAPTPALAQAPGTAPAPAADPAPARSRGWDGQQRWSIGLRTVSRSMAASSDEDRANPLELGGAGLTLRYRINRRWELDLALEHAEGELADGLITRTSAGITAAALFHMRPERPWDWYLLAGLGGLSELVGRDGKSGEMLEEQFQQAHVHLGLGLERRFRRFALGAELRFVGAALDPEEGDAPLYMEGQAPVPEDSSGAQLNLTATYFF